jgi:phosphoribosylformylglycinamidine synthase subunit PurQ / glutaminase
VVPLKDLMEGEISLTDFEAAVVPGGFSYGDHLGAGRIFGLLLVARLRDQLKEFLEAQRPMLGVCNGYQVLAEAGILPGRTPGRRSMALVENQSSHFEDRRVRLVVTAEKCVWTDGLAGEQLEMPSAHAEGRGLFCSTNPEGTARAVFRFADASGKPTTHYPENPSGAVGAVAGITDETGMVLGLMPHPERAALPAHESQDGLKIFQNLMRWLK